MFGLKLNNMTHFHPFEVMGRGSETQLEASGNQLRELTLKALNFFLKNIATFFQFEITINVLVSSFRFI